MVARERIGKNFKVDVEATAEVQVVEITVSVIVKKRDSDQFHR